MHRRSSEAYELIDLLELLMELQVGVTADSLFDIWQSDYEEFVCIPPFPCEETQFQKLTGISGFDYRPSRVVYVKRDL